MIDQVYLILAITQLFIFFVFGPEGMRLGVYMMVKKNPNWVMGHPEFTLHKTLEKLTNWFHYIVGGTSAAAIIYYALIEPTPEYNLMLMYRPLQVLAFGFLVIVTAQYFWLARNIPAPEISKATLTDRRLSNYIPMWTFWVANFSCAIVAVVYGYAFSADIIDMGKALIAFRVFFIVPIGANLAILFYIRRKHSESDYLFGENGRRFEVGVIVSMIYLIALIGFNWIYVDFFDGTPFNHDVVLIGTVVFLQAIALFATVHPKTREMLKEYKDFLTQ
jgi:hypothetical protein